MAAARPSWIRHFAQYESDFSGYVETNSHVGPSEKVKELTRLYEISTRSKFVKWESSKTFGSSTNDILKAHTRVCWKYRDGISDVPLIRAGTKQLECHQGRDHDAEKKNKRKEEKEKKKDEHDYTTKKKTRFLVQETKKLDCPAKIYLEHSLLFPDYKPRISSDKQRRRKCKELKDRLAMGNFENLNVVHRVEIKLPDPISGHVGHMPMMPGGPGNRKRGSKRGLTWQYKGPRKRGKALMTKKATEARLANVQSQNGMNEETAKEAVRNLLQNDLHLPVVFHHLIGTWPASSWKPETLHSLLGDKKFSFKIGSLQNDKDGVVWESECQHVEATIGDFLAWLGNRCTEFNPLLPYPQDKHWVYLDYKYIAKMFENQPNIYKDVQWDTFGFHGRDGFDSTLWMGSTGSYTPCHYDTYGCNLVAQIYGRKRWYLFPPEATGSLYPTRIPYEESSVFSNVDIKQPNLEKFPLFKETSPIVVTLEPGQVLFVPKHWWHYVESLETSISINSWIELESDHVERLSESVCQTLINSLMSSADRPESEWLNPGQSSQNHDANMLNLENVIKSLPKNLGPGMDEGPAISLHIADGNSDIRIQDRKRQRLSTENDSSVKSGNILFKGTNSGLCQKSQTETLSGNSLNTQGNPEQTWTILVSATEPPVVVSLEAEPMGEDDLELGLSAEDASLSCDCALCRIVGFYSREDSEPPRVEHLDSISFTEYLNNYTYVKPEIESQQMPQCLSNFDPGERTSKGLFEKVVNAVTHPDIIQKIVEKLKEEISADTADSPESSAESIPKNLERVERKCRNVTERGERCKGRLKSCPAANYERLCQICCKDLFMVVKKPSIDISQMQCDQFESSSQTFK